VEWRKAAEAGAGDELAPATKNRRDREIEKLRTRAEKAEAELTKTRAALDLVGKAHAYAGDPCQEAGSSRSVRILR
jgi:transposase